MSQININISIDEDLKNQAEDLFSDFGMSLEMAFTIFIKQCVREQRIPFMLSRNLPKIKSVTPAENLQVLVTFDNNVIKKFYVKTLINQFPIYEKLLDNEQLFNMVNVERGGYGIYWNDEIDISECEIWENGENILVE